LTGSQRFSSLAATRPHFLHINFPFLTSALYSSRPIPRTSTRLQRCFACPNVAFPLEYSNALLPYLLLLRLTFCSTLCRTFCIFDLKNSSIMHPRASIRIKVQGFILGRCSTTYRGFMLRSMQVHKR
jgi:hypothetical protein